MKKKIITYKNNPELGELQVIPDFLPSPEAFRRVRLAGERVSVRLTLPRDVVETVKREAKKRQSSYQVYLQSLISLYTRQKLHTSS